MKLLDVFPVVADFWVDAPAKVESVSAIHSGNIGDIIYALPTCAQLGVNHFIINLCRDPGFKGRVMTEKSARAMVPLLLAQPGMQRVTIVETRVPWEYASAADFGVRYNLDTFRLNFSNPYLHLIYQHALPFNLSVDPRRKWLHTGDKATSNPSLKIPSEPYVVVGLTERYRRFVHSFYQEALRDIPPHRIVWVGVEVDQVQRMGLNGEAYVAEDFLDLARLIEGASLFIGNPSFPCAIAELLKTPRWLDLPDDINVYPLDASGRVLHQFDLDYVRNSILETLQLTNETAVVFRKLKEVKAKLDVYDHCTMSAKWCVKRLIKLLSIRFRNRYRQLATRFLPFTKGLLVPRKEPS